MKASWKFLAGSFLVVVFGMQFGTSFGKSQVSKGDFLELYTRFNDDDYNYNREFQRMRYLTDSSTRGSTSWVTPYDLAEVGIKEENVKAGNFKKRAPHPKYY